MRGKGYRLGAIVVDISKPPRQTPKHDSDVRGMVDKVLPDLRFGEPSLWPAGEVGFLFSVRDRGNCIVAAMVAKGDFEGWVMVSACDQ
jgi:hypothetical protein